MKRESSDWTNEEPNLPSPDSFTSEEVTVIIPRITTRELVTPDPDGHYARARGPVAQAVSL